MQILFVCTGNICRSPTADGVFRHLVQAAGLADRIASDSCGLIDYHAGEPPDPRAVRAAARRGVDLTGLRARQLAREDFERFDLLLAMDQGNFAQLNRLSTPAYVDRIRHFLDFARSPGRLDVPDPYYGDDSDFDHALDLIEAGARGLLASLRSQT